MHLKLLLAALVIGLGGLSLSACNTVQGLGQDVESVGKAGEKAMD